MAVSEANPAGRRQLVLEGRAWPQWGSVGRPPSRDWEIVRWVGRMGAVTIEHVQSRFTLGRTAAYRRVAACIEVGLLDRVAPLRGQLSLIRATRRGLRYAGVRSGVAGVPPELVAHHIACTSVALLLEREFGGERVIGERELRVMERDESRAIASAKVGEHPDGSPKLHRPDLAVLASSGVMGVEVELAAKAPRRLEAIIRAWRRARWVELVRYYAAPGETLGGLERAVARVHAGSRVEIRSLGRVNAR
jgi:hypothetical protein